MSSVTTVTENSPMIEHPSGWSIRMFDHQLAVAHRCLKIESGDFSEEYPSIQFYPTFGLICSKVGHGKSYSVLALCGFSTQDKMLRRTDIHHVCALSPVRDNGCNVIIVPHGIILQWEKYVKNTGMPYSMFRTREHAEKTPLKQICLVSATMYAYFADAHKHELFSRLFIDEADSVRPLKATTVCIKSKMCWLVSANKCSVMRLSLPKYLQSYEGIKTISFHCPYAHLFRVEADTRFAEKSMNIPDAIVSTIKCAKTIFNGIVDDTAIEYIESGDVEGAVRYMGVTEYDTVDGIVAGITHALRVKMQEHQKAHDRIMHAHFRAHHMEKIEMYSKKIQAIEERLRSSNMCPVTMEEIQVPTVLTCCNNVFETEVVVSILKANNAKCPLCRTPISLETMVTQLAKQEDKPSDSVDLRKLSKISACKYLLSTAPMDKKILVFTHSDKCRDIVLEGRLLRGTASSQNQTIKWFKSDEPGRKLLFLDSRFSAEGLNLEFVDILIVFKTQHDERMEQMIGRCMRYGRKTPLELIILE